MNKIPYHLIQNIKGKTLVSYYHDKERLLEAIEAQEIDLDTIYDNDEFDELPEGHVLILKGGEAVKPFAKKRVLLDID